MSFVTAIVPVVPMRADASHRSEMVSQLLFGESAAMLERVGDFTRIRTLYDDYEGWCQTRQLISITGEQASEGSPLFSAELLTAITCNGIPMQIPFATPLHFFKDGIASIGKYEFAFQGKGWDPEKAGFDETTIRNLTTPFLNTAYLWGGRTVFGVDCSGFTQQVFRMMGIRLPRDAYQQAALGTAIGFLQEAQCGDLAFFDNAEGRITHVGIMLDTQTIIHASGNVRVDTIDTMGIVNRDTGERTHQLRIIKRYHP